MALTPVQKKLLNNATPGLAKVKLGDIIDAILTDLEGGGGGNVSEFGAQLLQAPDAAAARALLELPAT